MPRTGFRAKCMGITQKWRRSAMEWRGGNQVSGIRLESFEWTTLRLKNGSLKDCRPRGCLLSPLRQHGLFTAAQPKYPTNDSAVMPIIATLDGSGRLVPISSK